MILLSVVALPLLFTALTYGQVQVIPRRGGFDQNSVELECRNRNSGSLVPNAQFWLNEVVGSQNLRQILPPGEFTSQSSGISFTITRDLEGTYICGENALDVSSEEDSVRLIAYPSPIVRPSDERVFYAKSGSAAVIRCSILPGVLIDQYYVDWRNATSMVEVARIIGPRNVAPSSPPDPRVSIDEETFSLTIDPVTFSDAGSYSCELGVRETVQNGQLLVYTQTRDIGLELVVYQAPVITQPPRQTVVPFSPNTSVTFSCGVRGDPLPEVHWYHNNIDVEDSLIEGKYLISAPYFETSSGDFRVQSELVINNVDALDSGEVRCVAIATDEDLPVELSTSERSAQLIVISKPDDLVVLITTTGDIIFQVTLPVSILVPVQMRVRYLHPLTEEWIAEQVVTTGYNNTYFITHFQPQGTIPAAARSTRNVRIEIALFYRRHQGPFISSSGVIDLQTPTVFTEEEASVTRTIIIGVLVSMVIVALLTAMLVPVLVVVISRTRIRRRKADYIESLEQRESEHRLALDRKKTENQNRLNELEQTHNAVLLDREQRYEAELNKLREERRSELEQQRLEHESKLQQLQEKNENDWKRMTESNKHTAEMKALKLLEGISEKARRIQVKIGDVAFHVETESDYEALDEIDSPIKHYVASSGKRPLLKRGASIDYEHRDEKCVVGYMKTMLRASIRDPKLGPTLKKYIATELK